MAGDANRDEAREFLASFLLQLQASDDTNRQLTEVMSAVVQQNQALVSQNQAMLHQIQIVSRQFDGLAQRLDLLTEQVSRLSHVLEQDTPPAPMPGASYAPPPDLFGLPHNGQLGGRRRRG